jgi:hypothetical protein
MEDFVIGNLEPEESVMSYKDQMLSKIENIISALEWNETDDVVVEVGGVASSGIHQIEGVNPKWAKQFGTTTYQDDAFIVIKNRTRKPVISSQSNSELKQHHSSVKN